MKPLDFLRWAPGRRTQSAAPVLDLHTLVGSGPVFVLAPHPDDESIGCGGLIAACVDSSVPVFVHVLTDGRHSHPGSRAWPPERIAARRETEARRAGAHLGLSAQALTFERAIDGALLFDWAGANSMAARIAARVELWPAPVVLAPWRHDPHPDHMAAAVIADLIEQACPRARGLRFLVWAQAHAHAVTPHAVTPKEDSLLRFPIDAYRQRKRRAIRAHRTQTGRLIKDYRGRLTAPDPAAFLGRYETYLSSSA